MGGTPVYDVVESLKLRRGLPMVIVLIHSMNVNCPFFIIKPKWFILYDFECNNAFDRQYSTYRLVMLLLPSRHTLSKWRRINVDATLIRHHFNVVCPLGYLLNTGHVTARILLQMLSTSRVQCKIWSLQADLLLVTCFLLSPMCPHQWN